MFKLIKILNGRINVPEPEYLPTTAGVDYSEGAPLVLTSGKLAAATSGKPTFIAMKSCAADTCAELPVMRVDSNMVFSVEYAESTVVGAEVTVDGVTATVVEVGDGVISVIFE